MLLDAATGLGETIDGFFSSLSGEPGGVVLASGVFADFDGDKQRVLQSLQAHGESYDRAREVLKHVSVDSSGKVELDDWVEVRTSPQILSQSRGAYMRRFIAITAEREASQPSEGGASALASGQGHRAGLECERQPYHQ